MVSFLKRKPELTAVRGLAALWVFVYHIPIYLKLNWGIDIPLVSAGYLGVPVFFILSISLLLNSLDDNPSLEHYFKRRIKRIWPMYFFTVALVFLYYSHSLGWLVEQTTFSDVFIDNQSIGYVFWSLQIEEVAYLFFPVISRLSPLGKSRLAGVLYVSAALSCVLIFKTGTVFQLWWLPVALSSYGLGIYVYLRKLPSFTLPLVLMGLFYWDVIPFEMLSFIVAPGFAYLVQEATRFGFLRWKGFVWVGDSSYGLYLIHPLLLSGLGVVGAIVTLPASWAFEKANLKLVSRFGGRQAPSVAAGPASGS